jgi:exodeoxyribonuclease-3
MRITSWNVNSLKARIEHLERYLAESQPDVIALQETKLVDESFPHERIDALGYVHRAVSGQKTYNGVALLSKHPLEDVALGIAGHEDPQRRVIAATVNGIRIVNLYVVNGEAVGSEKFRYKLEWMDRVRKYLAEELERWPKMVVLGDFNVAPEDRDVYKPERWHEKILCSTPEREKLRGFLDLGFHDSFRLFVDEPGHHSWWDYRLLAFQRGWGLRIDLVLVSDALKKSCKAVGIDREPRTWERPSDHTPVWVELKG